MIPCKMDFFMFLFDFDLITNVIQISLIHVGEKIVGGHPLMSFYFSRTMLRFTPNYTYSTLLPA